jgi:Family of unknown function (DUF6922)
MSSEKNRISKLPEDFQHYFWDVSFEELTLDKYPKFIAELILNYGDLNAVKWLLSCTNKKFLRTIIDNSRNLNPKTKNYWQIVMADVPE